MGMRINTNVPALNAQRQTSQTSSLLNRALNQLSSGLRINRAADDAAGLAIAERFRAQIAQGQQEMENLQTGISAAQTAEGGLSAQQDQVQRLRELAVQASNGTLTNDQRNALNQEAQQILEQINTTAEQTTFNDIELLNNPAGSTNVDLGTEGTARLNVDTSTTATMNIDTVDLSTAAGATAAIDRLDQASQQISQNRAALGAQQNRYESAINQRSEAVLNQQESESRIRDLDVARGVLEQTRQEIRMQGGLSVLTQANVLPQNALTLLGG